jgi:hypothetical protein
VGKLIYRDGSAFVAPWVKEQEALLLEDKVEAGDDPYQAL